nr:immunoglobulin heavy chain junction region [Macaca mulatta]
CANVVVVSATASIVGPFAYW